MREIRRRTRVVGAFPDGQSCLNVRHPHHPETRVGRGPQLPPRPGIEKGLYILSVLPFQGVRITKFL